MNGSERTRQGKILSASEGMASLAIRDFLPNILDNIGDGVLLADNRGDILWLNRRQAELLGKSAGEAIGKSIWDFYPEWGAGEFFALWREAIATGQSRSIEIFCPRGALWLEIRLHPRAGGILLYSLDIGDRKEKEGFLDRLVNNSPSLLYVYDLLEERHIYLSPCIEEATGYSVETVLAMGPEFSEKAIHPDDLPRAAEHQEKLRRAPDNTSIDFEYRVRHRNGEWRWFSSRDTVFERTESGEARRILGIARDITERIAIEEALQLSEARFRLAARAIHGVIYDWNVATGEVYRSEGLEKLVGFAPEEVPPTREWWAERLHPEDRERLQGVYNDISETYYEAEYRVEHRDGHWVQVWDRGYLIYNDRGEVIRVVGCTSDISERVKAEKQLQTRAEELTRLNATLLKTTAEVEKRNQELEQFTYVISHDLKAPLRAISHLSQWIEDDLESELEGETRRYMNLLRGRVHRMENLINGLLKYSRAGRVRNRPELVSIERLLRGIIARLDPPPGFSIEFSGKMPVFMTLKLSLEEVFSSLIENAIVHHDRDRGKITIAAIERESDYEFAVTDDGPGIAPEYHRRIFALFRTLEARDKTEYTGIGLAIAKKIIEQQGGNITIETPGTRGTTFRFTWPRSLGV